MTNPKNEALDIITKFTDDCIRSISHKSDSNQELYEFMTAGCSYILASALLDGDYTPMEYNEVREELAKILWKVFEPHINAENNE